MTPEEWRSRSTVLHHRGHAVRTWVDGPPGGEPLLCLHGFPTASWDWHRVWPGLAERYRVFAFDMLGYGFSDKPWDHSYSLPDQADIAEALLGAHGVRRVHVLAHDVGDSVAQELLARHAEGRGVAVASACLLNGGLFPETHRPTVVQRLLASPLGPLVSRLMSERRFAASFAAVFGPRTKPSAEETAAFWSLLTWNDGHLLAHRLIGYMAERRRSRARWVGALQGSVPLLVVNGPEDPVSGAHMVQRLRQEVPRAEVVSLPGVGHYPQVEDPEGVLGAYLAFRERLAVDAA